jgi:hypothetical protein
MTAKARVSTIRQVLRHLTMGASLGAFLATSLLLTNAPHIFQMIINSAAPKLMLVVFVGTFTLIVAIGATLTGFILALEDRVK